MTTQERRTCGHKTNRLMPLLQQKLPDRDVVILDGAMGTMLQSYGLTSGECPELWNLTHPQRVMDVHRAYIRAGADIIETNTFGGTRIKLAGYGLSGRCFEINYHGVRLAKEAARGTPVLVAASMGPTGLLMEPFGDMDFDSAYEAFKEQAMAFREAGADLISIETVSSLGEAKAAVMAAKEATSLPVLCHMTFEHGGRTLMGTDAATAVTVLQALGVDAVGANCSVGPSEMVGVIREMAEVATVPISAEPNAGLPEFRDGETVYHETPEAMAQHVELLVEAGARIVGGCCGTTPSHIAAIRGRVGEAAANAGTPHRSSQRSLRLASRGKTVSLDGASGLPLLGDKIDVWRNPEVAESLRKGDMGAVSQKAREQVARGAEILLVRVDVPGLDEAGLMRGAIGSIQAAADVPLIIASRNPEAVEAGLKVFWGRPFVYIPDVAVGECMKIYEVAQRFGALVDPQETVEALIKGYRCPE